jgi:hypothetical protein
LVICQKYQAIIDSPALIETYDEKIKQENNIFMWVRSSRYTEKKAEIDRQRNETYSGVTTIVRTYLKHFDPLVHKAAFHVNNLLKNYGKLHLQNYGTKTVHIDHILAYLQSVDYINAVHQLGIMSWLGHLEDLNTQFKQYEKNVFTEKLEKPIVSAKSSRRQTDVAMRNITNRIESLATLNGNDDYLSFAREYNESVNYFNTLIHEHYGRLHARIDMSDANIDSIPSMTYTGMPIFVIPTVKLRKTTDDITEIIQLVFTQDFLVSFKNNVRPGTAIVIIKGIGKYKGKIQTTFNIYES